MTWQSSKLGEVIRFRRGHDLPDHARVSGTVPVIGSAGQNGWHNEALVKGPGVSIGRSGASIGKVTFTPADYWPHNACLYVTDFLGNDPHFIYYFLRTLNLAVLNSGAAQPSLNRNFVHAVPVHVPKPRLQVEIASILSAYDDLIENNQRRIALLEESARLLYREWFVHFRFPGHEQVKTVNSLPNGWNRLVLGEVCQAVGGGTPSTSKTEYWNNGDIPWYTPTDITRNPCLALLDSERKITEAGLRGSSAKLLPRGTVLMTSRASVGFFGITQQQACTNQGFICILPKEPHLRMFLLFNLMHRVEEVRAQAAGSTYKEISKSKFNALGVLVPDSHLLRKFEKEASILHSQVRTLHSTNQKLAQARDLLLPRLMSGDIKV